MNSVTKKILLVLGCAVLAFAITTISCKTNKGSANTVFAETGESIEIPKDSLAVTQSLQNTFRAISTQVLPAVVEVDVEGTQKVQTFNPFKDLPFFFGNPEEQEDRTYERKVTGLGSGVIVRRDGNKIYVLTNNHVTKGANKITIKLHDEREFEGKLVGADERYDIALVCFESSDKSITIAKLGDSDSVQQGDIVLALGSPLGYFASVTQGIVSATGRSGSQVGSVSDFIQTDASINQGNSGGPLVNIYGEVIGINTWIASSSGGSQGLGFSIPINNIKPTIEQFIKDGKVTHGWVGISLFEIDSSYKKSLGLADNVTGSLVAEVVLNGPAFKSGIKPGDVIIKLNDQTVKNSDQLVRSVSLLKTDTTAKFTVIRNGETKDINVKVGPRDETTINDTSKLWPGFIPFPITEDVQKQLKLDNSVKGVIVANVSEKSPAAALRISKNDIITAVNDVKVSNLKEFYTELNKADKELWFDIYSDGHTVTTSKYKIEK